MSSPVPAPADPGARPPRRRVGLRFVFFVNFVLVTGVVLYLFAVPDDLRARGGATPVLLAFAASVVLGAVSLVLGRLRRGPVDERSSTPVPPPTAGPAGAPASPYLDRPQPPGPPSAQQGGSGGPGRPPGSVAP